MPSGAIGCAYGLQSGVESLMSMLMTPLNGFATLPTPMRSRATRQISGRFDALARAATGRACRHHLPARALTSIVRRPAHAVAIAENRPMHSWSLAIVGGLVL